MEPMGRVLGFYGPVKDQGPLQDLQVQVQQSLGDNS